jgi:hypothetical protein
MTYAYFKKNNLSQILYLIVNIYDEFTTFMIQVFDEQIVQCHNDLPSNTPSLREQVRSEGGVLQ